MAIFIYINTICICTLCKNNCLKHTCSLSNASNAASHGKGRARERGTSYVLEAEAAEAAEWAEPAEFAEALEVAEVSEPVPLHAESALAGRGARGASYQSPRGLGQS